MEEKEKEKKKIKKIGPYYLLNQIGSGSFSRVFKAKTENPSEKVAVKMIPVQKLNDKTLERV